MWKENPAFDIFREGAINYYYSSFLPLVKGGNHCVHAEHHCEKRRRETTRVLTIRKKRSSILQRWKKINFLKKKPCCWNCNMGKCGFSLVGGGIIIIRPWLGNKSAVPLSPLPATKTSVFPHKKEWKNADMFLAFGGDATKGKKTTEKQPPPGDSGGLGGRILGFGRWYLSFCFFSSFPSKDILFFFFLDLGKWQFECKRGGKKEEEGQSILFDKQTQ